MVALSKRGGNIDERHFVLSVSRSALASKWVQEQVGNADEFLREAGAARFRVLLIANDGGPDDFPEVLLHSRSEPAEFRMAGDEELISEITRVRVKILEELRTAAYSGRGRVSKQSIAECVCTRDSVLDRALVYLGERGFVKGALTGEMKITTAGEAELENSMRQLSDSSSSNPKPIGKASPTVQYDVFISHASEDKQVFAKPLADRLAQTGIRVWYDDFTLKLGDSLRASIDQGLRNSRFGVVILSHAFFTKSWPQRELAGLFALATESERRILPIWHDVSAEELKTYSPMLADLKAARSSDGVEAVVAAIVDVVRSS